MMSPELRHQATWVFMQIDLHANFDSAVAMMDSAIRSAESILEGWE